MNTGKFYTPRSIIKLLIMLMASTWWQGKRRRYYPFVNKTIWRYFLDIMKPFYFSFRNGAHSTS